MDRGTDSRTDGGDCNIPITFFKSVGIINQDVKKKKISLRNVRDGLLLPGQRRLWSANTFILKLADQGLLLFPKLKDCLHSCYKPPT